MDSKFLARAALVAMMSLVPVAALSADITIDDPYARTSRPGAPTGAAFMSISNTGSEADRLVSVRSDAAKRVELLIEVEQPGDEVDVAADLSAQTNLLTELRRVGACAVAVIQIGGGQPVRLVKLVDLPLSVRGDTRQIAPIRRRINL